jgi:hypothetical protein
MADHPSPAPWRGTRRHTLALAARCAALGLAPAAFAAAPARAARQDETVSGQMVAYFAETGHNLGNPNLGLWETAGGRAVVGVPLSEERFVEHVGVVQTFEGLSIVYDPTLDAPWDLQGQHLPDTIKRSYAPSTARTKPKTIPAGETRFDNGFSAGGAILAYWETHGGLPIFGMPLSQAWTDRASGAVAQLFERAVIEERGTRGVRLRPVWADYAASQGWIDNDPAFWPAPPTGGQTRLVKSPDGLNLRGGPSTDADIRAQLDDNAEFIMAPGAAGDWLAGYADGYAGWVSASYIGATRILPTIDTSDWDLTVWQGASLGESNVRSEPSTNAPITRVLEYGEAIEVTAWVEGEEVYEGADLWARIGPKEFVYGRNVGRNAPVLPTPLPPGAPETGRWIDVNLTQQLMMAYEGRTLVRTCLVTTGMAGWETPPGSFAISVRVANETMESGSIGADHFYKLEDVLFTQYFTDEGHAIHFAWWRTPETIGRPGSHGCLNLLLDDARFFWDWATWGTPIITHY